MQEQTRLGNGHDPKETGLPVSQYVRMSTEHQRYSTENQATTIAEYAARHGMRIVRTYEDAGMSAPIQI